MSRPSQEYPYGCEVAWRGEEVLEAIDQMAPDFYELHESSYVKIGNVAVPPLVVTLKMGGRQFSNDLTDAAKQRFPDFDPDRAFATWRTYWQPTENGAEPVPTLMRGIPKFRVLGRKALVLDDILETGTTSHANEEYLIKSRGAVSVDNVYMFERINPAKPQLAKATLSAIKTDRRAWVIGRDFDDKKLTDDPYWKDIFPDGGRSLYDVLVSPNSPHEY